MDTPTFSYKIHFLKNILVLELGAKAVKDSKGSYKRWSQELTTLWLQKGQGLFDFAVDWDLGILVK